METTDKQIRRILARGLGQEESFLTDDFRWLDAIGVEEASYLLTRINDAYVEIPMGFSFGSGKIPFDRVDAKLLEKIATVGGLIEYVRERISAIQS